MPTKKSRSTRARQAGQGAPAARQAALMTLAWNNLLFAHWHVRADILQDLLPPTLKLDTYGDRAWIGITPFLLSDLTVRGVPAIPRLAEFPEINVRTYVVADGTPGIYFLSLDAGRAFAALGARLAFFLPYHFARMKLEPEAEGFQFSSIRISPRTLGASFIASYRPLGPDYLPVPGTLEHWLTERYRFYVTAPDATVWRGDIRHATWRLQHAAAKIEHNTLTTALGFELPPDPPLLNFARRMEVQVRSFEPEHTIPAPPVVRNRLRR